MSVFFNFKHYFLCYSSLVNTGKFETARARLAVKLFLIGMAAMPFLCRAPFFHQNIIPYHKLGRIFANFLCFFLSKKTICICINCPGRVVISDDLVSKYINFVTGRGGQVVKGAISNSRRENALGPRFESPLGITIWIAQK